jgi:tetratricopeptide (TPR) repeat protein
MAYSFGEVSMKWLWLIMVFCTTAMYAQQDEELFLQANIAYKHQAFKEALNRYDHMMHKGEAVWQNMGNCAYQLARYDQALLYWRRAQKFAYAANYYILENNIRTLYQQHDLEMPYSFFERYVHALAVILRYIPCIIWQLVFILCLSILGILFLIMKRKKLIFICLLLMYFLISIGLIAYYYAANRRIGIVRDEHAKLYTGKDTRFKEIKNLSHGQELVIMKESDDWLKVHDATTVGWIPRTAVELV